MTTLLAFRSKWWNFLYSFPLVDHPGNLFPQKSTWGLQREVGSPARTSPAPQNLFGDFYETFSYLSSGWIVVKNTHPEASSRQVPYHHPFLYYSNHSTFSLPRYFFQFLCTKLRCPGYYQPGIIGHMEAWSFPLGQGRARHGGKDRLKLPSIRRFSWYSGSPSASEEPLVSLAVEFEIEYFLLLFWKTQSNFSP